MLAGAVTCRFGGCESIVKAVMATSSAVASDAMRAATAQAPSASLPKDGVAPQAVQAVESAASAVSAAAVRFPAAAAAAEPWTSWHWKLASCATVRLPPRSCRACKHGFRVQGLGFILGFHLEWWETQQTGTRWTLLDTG